MTDDTARGEVIEKQYAEQRAREAIVGHATPANPAGLREAWDETRRLVLTGRVVISQTPTDPGDLGEPRLHTEDDTTYVSVPEFELWPTDPDWQPHDASIVFISERAFALAAPGKIVYHVPRYPYHQKTRCGIVIWDNGRPVETPLVSVRRDVASRVARPCNVCGGDR